MAAHAKRIDFIAAEYSRMSARAFVAAVNRAYYSRAAAEYDNTHPDINHDAVRAWNRIIPVLSSSSVREAGPYTVVDIGSGTGFVASRLLGANIPFTACRGLEPSDHMREIAARKISDQRVSFHPFDIMQPGALSAAVSSISGSKIITLNSVLHHIVWWEDFLHEISNVLATGDLLVLCHEPNSRFWGNLVLTGVFEKITATLREKRRMLLFLNPLSYVRKLRRLLFPADGKQPAPHDHINRELNEANVLKKDLPAPLIPALIDYGVPPCWRGIPIDVSMDEGFFDGESIRERFFADTKKLLFFTYQHLAISPELLTKAWKSREKEFSREYPLDGAQFCIVLQKE